MRIRTLVSGLLLTAALAATPAFADYDAAERAMAAKDYATARKELAPLSEGFDSRVYLMLGVLNRNGNGGPADLKEAYRDFSLAFMYSDDPGQRVQAFGERTLAARKMTPAEIVASEALVAATVSARLTPEGLKREIDSLSALHPAILKLGNAPDEGLRTAARQALDIYVLPELSAVAGLMEKGDMKAALVKLETVLEMNPWSAEMLDYRAEAKRSLGDIDGALADYLSAMERRGFAYDEQFRLQEAGAWQGEVTGDSDATTRKALEKCIRDNACFAKYRRFK